MAIRKLHISRIHTLLVVCLNGLTSNRIRYRSAAESRKHLKKKSTRGKRFHHVRLRTVWTNSLAISFRMQIRRLEIFNNWKNKNRMHARFSVEKKNVRTSKTRRKQKRNSTCHRVFLLANEQRKKRASKKERKKIPRMTSSAVIYWWLWAR